jgi:hypothetical protein
MLSAALYRKGILTQSEMAQVSEPVRFVPAVAANLTLESSSVVASIGAPAERPTQTPATTTAGAAGIPEVTSMSHFPIQIYGTVLWNSFYNTGGTNIEDIPLLASKTGTDPNGNFGMTVRQSRFGLRYQGPEVWGAKLSGTVEMDLLGGAAALGNGVAMDLPRLRLAYGRMDWKNTAIEAGQDWAVFFRVGPRDAMRTVLHDQLACSFDELCGAKARRRDGQDIRLLEQLILGNQGCARSFGGLGRHVLAPGNQIHSKSLPNPSDL